ncbi:MAG TPA: AAA family ATPase [Bryobacteraceae bacterium]|nr:AAA family ATPase [Bryobacteraceae bacterium]
MYNQFFGLREDPFNLTPDSRFLYLTWAQRRALAGLTYALLSRKRCVVLTGDVGTGKTTLIAAALRCLPADRVRFSVIANPTLTPEELLESALLGFGVTEIPSSKPQRWTALERAVAQEEAQGRVPAVVIDEAQKLSLEALEEVRLLGNLEAMQVVLAGQKEFHRLLARKEAQPFKQRIALRLTTDPLSAEEVGEYISHRWTKAGGTPPGPFEPQAVRTIVLYSGGIPRLINVICDNALMTACAEQTARVEERHIRQAAASLDLSGPYEAAEDAEFETGNHKGVLSLR